jgi:hypothetical protein
MLVPPHQFTSLLPGGMSQDVAEGLIMGNFRFRYMWIQDGKLAILFKNGPEAWSEDYEACVAALKAIPGFDTITVVERDKCYIIATFTPVRPEVFVEICELDQTIVTQALEEKEEYYSITTNPFDIFDIRLEKLKTGELNPTVAMEQLIHKLDEIIKETKEHEESQGD